jgi:hypothetical protein
MNPLDVASATTLLAPIFGARAAGVVSLMTLALGVASALMTVLPVASATSPGWYRAGYGVMAWVTFNFGRMAPVPANGQIAGGMVPTPTVATQAVIVPAPQPKPLSTAESA